MSAQLGAQLREMCQANLDTVLSIERQIHSHPWSRGNFNDALSSGNICRVYEAGNEIIGYAVMMPAPDDVDLLDIGIASAYQRKGLGAGLLGEMLELARSLEYERVILEMRQTNLAAYALYRKVGFKEIGLSRDYYPAQNGREDAIVMEYTFK